MQISSVSAVLCSTDGLTSMIPSCFILKPRFLTYEARQKAGIFLMSARTDGERMDLSRLCYLKFIF
jgi:hypothetical protein